MEEPRLGSATENKCGVRETDGGEGKSAARAFVTKIYLAPSVGAEQPTVIPSAGAEPAKNEHRVSHRCGRMPVTCGRWVAHTRAFLPTRAVPLPCSAIIAGLGQPTKHHDARGLL